MKFENYKYRRVDIEEIQKKVSDLFLEMKEAKDFDSYMGFVEEVNVLRRHVKTMLTLCEIRHTIDTEDEFYQKEQEFCDEVSPSVEKIDNDFFRILLESNFRGEFEKSVGGAPVKKIEAYLSTFNSDVLDDLKEENKLMSEYGRLVASAKIQFRGEEMNLSQVMKFSESLDRAERKEAMSTYFKFFENNEAEFDRIFDELVRVRTKIAKKLGFGSFTPVAYNRLKRIDYDPVKVEKFRDLIVKHVVPLVSKLKEEQRKRLDVDKLMFYDEPLLFSNGNADLKKGIDIVSCAKKMFSEIDVKTGEYFDYMVENNLMDLETKKGKRAGAYCEFLRDMKSPFVFCNFNGTSNDINELTHESGHGFDAYMGRDDFTKDYTYSGYETCEIHSMSMELFCGPWMNLFFEDVKKYNCSNLLRAFFFLPYGCLVDEFQHFVYENPDVSPLKRREQWRRLEKKYLPWKDYGDNCFLNSGGLFFRQLHFFEWPFYYIDYVLAQVCAFQIWDRSRVDFDSAFKDYLGVVKNSDKKSFVEALESGNLKSPFEEETVENLVKGLKSYLEIVDN